MHAALERLLVLGGVQALVVFGSRARGEARPDSDLDLAVILQEAQLSPEAKAERWHCCRQAIGPLGVGVDLVGGGFGRCRAVERLPLACARGCGP